MAVAVPAPDPAARRAALLFERHYEAVFGYCAWRLRTHVDAEEAAQTTFARALGALRRGHRPRNERAWLVTIARNVCTTLGTAPHRALEIAGDVPHGVSPDVDEGLAPELEAALAALPEGQRRALLLREWHALSYREIAAELGVSVSTVESWIFRARRSLASALGSAQRQLGLGALLRWLGPGAGAKVGAATLLATAVVATERALETRRVETDRVERAATTRRDRPAFVTRATPEGPVAPVAPSALAGHDPRTQSPAPEARPTVESPRSPVAETTSATRGSASSEPAAVPGRAGDPSPASTPPAPTPVQPPPAPPPPVQEPSVPVPDPELPAVPVPSVPDLPVQPPALPVEPPALPVDVPQLPSTLDLPADLPKVP